VALVSIGFIGCAEPAEALARGWGKPFLCADTDHDRALALAAHAGGAALASHRAVARRAEMVVLCHGRGDLGDIAEAIAPCADIVVSTITDTPLDTIRRAYTARSVYRVAVNRPAAIKRGITVLADAPPQPDDDMVRSLFARLGNLIVLDDALIDTAVALMRHSAAVVEMHTQGPHGRAVLAQLDEFLHR
jgi:pyrroline-5-carboxylate reductase